MDMVCVAKVRWIGLSVLSLITIAAAHAEDAPQSVGDAIMVSRADYGIIDYELDTPSSVLFTTRQVGIFEDTYTIYRTICGGSFMTLFVGQGSFLETAKENSRIKGNGGLLLWGTGDDAPKLACAAAGAVPAKFVIVGWGKR